MPTLPTGTVTFLFTDIEGSTTLWQQHPGAMPTVLARHNTILRACTESHGGYVFQIIGDACCAAFSTAAAALNAALAAQRALRDEPWNETGPLRVRMALHAGTADVHAGDYTSGEYSSSITLARAARLLSTGHGGQVLLSQTARDLVENDLPAGVTLRDLGEYRLKDLLRPERVHQVVAADLPAEFPPLWTLDTLPNNLPIQLTSFVGRASDLAAVKRLLVTTRLLTITGTGGTGKTRLSLAVAAELLDEFPDGAWLVELAPVADPNLIPQAIADALGVRESPGRPLTIVLMDYLRAKQLLLIVDNCEHLIEAIARLVDQVLHQCPHLKILASSREALGIAGETAYRLPSLSLPTTSSLSNPLDSEAVQLFVDRARAVQPHFELTEQNASAVVRICERLDGIPLALELAAARVAVFTPEQIATRLSDSFRLLTGGSRTAMPRQQTLRAAIDWSYSLLCEDERALLRGLSVFAGGWSFEAAESVFAGSIDVLEMLPRLVSKSMVIADEQMDEVRYRMLETVRQYAREELVKTPQAASVHDRHLEYYVSVAKTAHDRINSREMPRWVNLLEVEHDNLRHALEWGLETRPLLSLDLAVSLAEFWTRRGYSTEGRRWMEQAILSADAAQAAGTITIDALNPLKAKALIGLGRLMLIQGEDPSLARDTLEAGIALAQETGDKLLLIYGYAFRALDAIFLSDFDGADVASARALELARRTGDPNAVALATGLRSQFLFRSGRDEERSLILHTESTRLSDELGLTTEAAGMRYGFAYVAMVRKQYTEARLRFKDALKFYRAVGDIQFENMALSGLADVARLQGDWPEAVELYRQVLALWTKMGHRGAIARVLECLAFITSAQGRATMPPDTARLKAAATLLGAGDALRQAASSPMVPEERTEYGPELAAVQSALEQDTFEAAWTAGRAMSQEQAISYALREATA